MQGANWGRVCGAVQDGMPFIGPQKGALLQGLVRERRPRHVVEVGTMCGYSALLLAQALGPGRQLITIEADWKWALAAKRFVWQATQGDKSSKAVRPPPPFAKTCSCRDGCTRHSNPIAKGAQMVHAMLGCCCSIGTVWRAPCL